MHTKKRERSFFIIAKTPEARKLSLGDKKGTGGHGGSKWSFLTSKSEAMSYPHAVLPPRCAALLKLLAQVTIWSTFLFASWSLSHNIPRSQIHYLQQPTLGVGSGMGQQERGTRQLRENHQSYLGHKPNRHFECILFFCFINSLSLRP